MIEPGMLANVRTTAPAAFPRTGVFGSWTETAAPGSVSPPRIQQSALAQRRGHWKLTPRRAEHCQPRPYRSEYSFRFSSSDSCQNHRLAGSREKLNHECNRLCDVTTAVHMMP